MKMTAKQTTIAAYSGLSAGLLLCLLAIFGLILTGCGRENVFGSGNVVTEQRTVSPFEDVILEGSLQVEIKQGQNGRVNLQAEDNVMRYIETTVSGTTLRVRLRNGVNLRHSKPIHVYLESEKYRKVLFSGSGSVTGNDTIKSTLFIYEINGSADARLKVEANEVQVRVDGSGDITMEGKAGDYSSVINGSGNIGAASLQSARASIQINGSGEQQIWVMHELNARINGSGNIRYKGTPATVNSTVSGSGKISKL